MLRIPGSRPGGRAAGFILLESLLALFTFALAFLVLESSWTLIARAVTFARQESIAATLARAQRERRIAGACAVASGADSIDGVSVAWESAPDSGSLRVHQTSRFHGSYGERVVVYDSRAACRR